MTPAALAANRANAKKAGRPKGSMNADKLELSARCRVNDERHIEILERIAQFSANEGYQLAAIRDLMDRGHGKPRQAIEGSGPGGTFNFNVQLPVVIHNADSDEPGPTIDGHSMKLLP
jgi:DNA-binding transcriptional MerR regulator